MFFPNKKGQAGVAAAGGAGRQAGDALLRNLLRNSKGQKVVPSEGNMPGRQIPRFLSDRMADNQLRKQSMQELRAEQEAMRRRYEEQYRNPTISATERLQAKQNLQQLKEQHESEQQQHREQYGASLNAGTALAGAGKGVKAAGALLTGYGGEIGLRHILISFAAWLGGFGLSLGGQAPIYLDLPFLLFLLFTAPRNGLLWVAALFEIGSSFQNFVLISMLPDIFTNLFFNPVMPWWPIYAILLSGGRGSKVAAALYTFTVLLGIGLLLSNMVNQPLFVLGQDLSGQVSQEQLDFGKSVGGQAITGFRDFFVNIGKGAVGGVQGFINPRIAAASGDTLYGQPKERPKLGVVIERHPSGAAIVGDATVVKARLTLPNLPTDKNYLTITDISCWYEKDKEKTWGRILEYSEKDMQAGIPLFYNTPRTVSCQFDSKVDSTVTLSAAYNFDANVRLTTYLMKEELLENLLIQREDPLDYMAVPANKRRPVTYYDNGPARFGIGPVELTNPPLGIKSGKTYPAFEFVVGNSPEFNGKIRSIERISLTLPRGVFLENGETCIFRQDTKETGTNRYVAILTPQNQAEFTNIQSSRLFTCNMNIPEPNQVLDGDADAGALGQSYSEAEFAADVSFTYETQQTLSGMVPAGR